MGHLIIVDVTVEVTRKSWCELQFRHHHDVRQVRLDVCYRITITVNFSWCLAEMWLFCGCCEIWHNLFWRNIKYCLECYTRAISNHRLEGFNDLLQTHTAPLFWSSQVLRISERAVLKLPCLPSQKGETLEVSVVILRARHSQHFHTIWNVLHLTKLHNITYH